MKLIRNAFHHGRVRVAENIHDFQDVTVNPSAMKRRFSWFLDVEYVRGKV